MKTTQSNQILKFHSYKPLHWMAMRANFECNGLSNIKLNVLLITHIIYREEYYSYIEFRAIMPKKILILYLLLLVYSIRYDIGWHCRQ